MRHAVGVVARGVALMAAFCVSVGLATTAFAATLKATVDLSEQRMHVYVDGRKKYTWVVSTGKRGWRTKPGWYTPFAQREKFYSSKWRMSLPYLTWIGSDGTAIHGTYQTKKLGRPASHGCIRLSIFKCCEVLPARAEPRLLVDQGRG